MSQLCCRSHKHSCGLWKAFPQILWEQAVPTSFVVAIPTRLVGTAYNRKSCLRECLRKHALNLVPESTVTKVEDAWKVLDQAFGDATKLLKHRWQELANLDVLPGYNQSRGHKLQIEWYLKVENTLRNIISLGQRSVKLGDEVFRDASICTVLMMFPIRIRTKLKKCSGERMQKMEAILEKVAELRVEAQELQQIEEAASLNIGKVEGKKNRENNPSVHSMAMPAYKPPRRDEKCRICTTLESQGDTDNLYDDHLHDHPSGCPRYIKMTIEQRFEIATKAKLCLKCHNPEYIYVPRDSKHQCMKSKRFSCKKCFLHMWVCKNHKNENKEYLYKFKDDYQKDFSLRFGFCVVGQTSLAKTTEKRKATLKDKKEYKKRKTEAGSKSPSKTKAKNVNVAEEETVIEEMVEEDSGKKDSTVGKLASVSATADVQEAGLTSPEKTDTKPKKKSSRKNSSKNVDSAASCDHTKKSISTNEATEKLKKKLSASGDSVELRPIPKGRAQFIIGETKGKTRPLVTMYDSGCYGMLMKEGVQHELGKTVLKTQGPVNVFGVGNTAVQVNSEWQTSLPLVDGTRQAVEGWTVDQVTAPLPKVDLSKAVAEIKADRMEDEMLQSLAVQMVTGGECDILLGLLYSAIFPISIHSLPNGLTIYKLQVSPHDDTVNSCIGGPHESFEYMAQQVGGANILFHQLMEQLEVYKKIGPPKIPKSIMSVEDIMFAEKHKEWEMGNYTSQVFEDFDGRFEEIDITECEDETEVDDNLPVENICCSMCGIELCQDSQIVESLVNSLTTSSELEDDSTQALKRLQQAHQEGLQIEYRCPRCRQCNDCRRSFETERVSLREEAEDQEVYDSVTIDWKNKQIICYLPCRGKEEEFLSSNRDIAMKILDQQCVKYHKDVETKATIVKAFQKLLKNKQMVLWDDLTQEQKSIIESKEISHYIPWRVVFKPSLSTPCRPVFDASTNTKPREGNLGGRCLNDLVVKGRVVTLNLMKLVLRWEVGAHAVQGDLKQFYASIKLVVNQWNLQRVLYREDLDPKGKVLEAVIKTLIWGVKSVSAQSECSLSKLAEFVKAKNHKLYDLLINCRFVDDIGTSEESLEILKKLVKEADELFAEVGLECKGYTFSGSDPPPDVAEDGQTVSIGGLKWYSRQDLLEVPIPPLHFSKKQRGRLIVGTQVFDGSCLEDMDKFVPKKLTLRMVFSKNASLFDMVGKLAPLAAVLKMDLRKARKEAKQWDDAIPDDIRFKWVQNFWRLEKLKGMKFQRARMPENAVSTDMDLILCVDAAEEIIMIGAWGRFKLKDGQHQFSCQLILGRSMLAGEDSTIPKNELDGLTMGSNLGWILRQSLENWVKSYIVVGDSTIALCWTTSDKKRLSLFHRNRCVQIRRGTDLSALYHVETEHNPADVGTRPKLVQDSDIGPNSIWEKGMPWMKEEISTAVSKGILTPVSELRLAEADEDNFKKGLVFERTKEILTPGHVVQNHNFALISVRVQKVKERSDFSDYAIPPNRFKFEKIVRILSIVRKFLRSFKCLKGKLKHDANSLEFQMFQADTRLLPVVMILRREVIDVYNPVILRDEIIEEYAVVNIGFGVEKPEIIFKGKHFVEIEDQDISWSLNYLYKKATLEVEKFCSSDFIKKIAVKKHDILVSRSRILASQRFQAAGDLEDISILEEFGLKTMTPVLERFSPLSYSIGDYIHRKLAKHAGYENCLRESLNHVFIIQGLSLFREIGDDCVRCLKKRKKFLEIIEGSVPNENFFIAPAFWITMSDLYGPCHIYVPGHSMMTRHRKAIDVKCYVLVNVCPVTKLVNLQVIETKSAEGIIDGITRLSCEIGVPSLMLVDQDSGIMKALREAEVDVRNMDLLLHREKGIRFKTCPVSGHNYHGLVEAKIKTVQECLDKCDIATKRLHATGLQTFCKLVENDMNNLPMGFTYARSSENSPLMKLVFPNMMRVGRINSRSLQGPIKLPNGPGELLEKVEKAYSVFYKLWNITVIPKLMKMHKWYDGKSQLMIGDIVYFRKTESELSSDWTVGKVFDVVKGRDEFVRRATIQYQNSSEEEPRFTDRAARSLIKLFNIDDVSWQQDMDEVDRLLKAVKESKNDEIDDKSSNAAQYSMSHTGEGLRFRLTAVSGHDPPVRELGVQHRPAAQVARAKFAQPCQDCCCYSHCKLTEHGRNLVTFSVTGSGATFEYADLLDRSWLEDDDYVEEMYNATALQQDQFMSLLTAVQTDFDDVEL